MSPARKRGATPRFYAEPPPGLDTSDLSGHLIVVEGADGSGRSTQVALLKEWLESVGWAVQTTGLRRSNLLARDIDAALAKNTATRMTLALMYATDFFDQLEHRIIPALRSGFVVLADRYIFTLIARAAVRGVDRRYLQGIYSVAVRPDMTFRLKVRPRVAFEREFRKNRVVSFWESGRDMYLAENPYDSFVKYQGMLRKEFDLMALGNAFVAVEGEASVLRVNAILRHHVAKLLGIKRTRYKPSPGLLSPLIAPQPSP